MLSIALVYSSLKDRIRSVTLYVFFGSLLAFSGLCMMAFPFIIPYRGSIPLAIAGYTLAATFSASLIGILVTHPETGIVRKIFRNRILSFFGKYSYSMYLLHVPISIAIIRPLLEFSLSGRRGFLLFVFLSYLFTILSAVTTWNLLEKHMLSLKKHFE